MNAQKRASKSCRPGLVWLPAALLLLAMGCVVGTEGTDSGSTGTDATPGSDAGSDAMVGTDSAIGTDAGPLPCDEPSSEFLETGAQDQITLLLTNPACGTEVLTVFLDACYGPVINIEQLIGGAWQPASPPWVCAVGGPVDPMHIQPGQTESFLLPFPWDTGMPPPLYFRWMLWITYDWTCPAGMTEAMCAAMQTWLEWRTPTYESW